MTGTDDPGEMARLVDLTGGEAQVVADLAACVTRLHQVQQAKVILSQLDPATLREVLAARRRSLHAITAATP